MFFDILSRIEVPYGTQMALFDAISEMGGEKLLCSPCPLTIRILFLLSTNKIMEPRTLGGGKRVARPSLEKSYQ
jgi:hypothetical protein